MVLGKDLLLLEKDYIATKVSGLESGGVLTKTVLFNGTSGRGAVGTINLFRVIGLVKVRVIGICEANLAGTNATISVGVAGATSSLINTTTATDIDEGMVWVDDSPAIIEALTDFSVVGSVDIIATVATANITGGKLTFICEWEELKANSAVTIL